MQGRVESVEYVESRVETFINFDKLLFSILFILKSLYNHY